jgi:PleD family two-component response regulator
MLEPKKATINLGLTEMNNEDTIDNVVKRAGDALYKEKSKGKSSIMSG